MSIMDAVKPFLPSATAARGATQIGAGIAAHRAAKASAERLREIGAEEAGLRRIQRARLMGKIRASMGKRGLTGVTAHDLEEHAYLLESRDVARAEFRFTSLADRAEAAGRAELAAGIVGGIFSGIDLLGARSEEEATERLKRATGISKGATRSRTAIAPGPRFPGLGGPQLAFGRPAGV